MTCASPLAEVPARLTRIDCQRQSSKPEIAIAPEEVAGRALGTQFLHDGHQIVERVIGIALIRDCLSEPAFGGERIVSRGR